jgi:glycosyltransferase involved in cell wall biosynthesis
MARVQATLLFVANFPANTGYAWPFIEGLYARIADHVASHCIRTLVSYPKISSPPRTLDGSVAVPVVLDGSLGSMSSLRAFTRLIRKENVKVVYFADHLSRSWKYLLVRAAGCSHIIVHRHVAGAWNAPQGLRRAVKWVLSRLPGIVANKVVAVSEYAARHEIEATLIPAYRVVTVWNGMNVERPDVQNRRTHALLGIAPDRTLVLCSGRASPEKGIDHLLRSFSLALKQMEPSALRPVLVYAGDGPMMPEVRALHESLPCKQDIVLAGYRPDADDLIEGADICVVPSRREAFSLALLRAMACGIPSIGSRVGGIPELISDGVDGLLVPPDNEPALAHALVRLITDRMFASQIGEMAQKKVKDKFSPYRQIRLLTRLIEEGFGTTCEYVRDAV